MDLAPSSRASSAMPEDRHPRGGGGSCAESSPDWAHRLPLAYGPLERLVQAARAMVRLSIAVNAASPRAAQDLLDALHYIVLSTRLEPGCLSCSALTGPDGVSYVEEWGTEADMRRRVRSDAFTPLLSIIETAENS